MCVSILNSMIFSSVLAAGHSRLIGRQFYLSNYLHPGNLWRVAIVCVCEAIRGQIFYPSWRSLVEYYYLDTE